MHCENESLVTNDILFEAWQGETQYHQYHLLHFLIIYNQNCHASFTHFIFIIFIICAFNNTREIHISISLILFFFQTSFCIMDDRKSASGVNIKLMISSGKNLVPKDRKYLGLGKLNSSDASLCFYLITNITHIEFCH